MSDKVDSKGQGRRGTDCENFVHLGPAMPERGDLPLEILIM